MSNTKISALTSATTPLAGTEVLPIVQSSTTKKVAVSDLTAGRTVSAARLDTSNNAGGGIMSTFTSGWSNTTLSLQGSGTTGAAVFNVSNVAASAAYPLEVWMNGTKTHTFDTGGNIIPAIAAKGINFTANTAAAGKTSQLLNWYEEGTWTPAIVSSGGAITTVGAVSGKYTRVGRLVHYTVSIAITTNGTGSGYMRITGWPFSVSNGMVGTGVETGVTGKQLELSYATTGTMASTFYDGTYPGANGAILQYSMSCEV